MIQIYAVGETLLDIIFKEGEVQTAKPGGSAFNTAVSLGRLGAPVNFISEMGKDLVGDLIWSFMKQNGIDTRFLSTFEPGKTSIALAFLDERNDAAYEFYKDYPAQRLALDFPVFRPDDLLIFGSFYALNPGIRHRVRALIDQAVQAGVTIIYDPNFRSSHLAERDQLVPVIRHNIEAATLVRASNEDLENIFGVSDPEEAWEQLRSSCDALVYTAHAHGVYLYTDKIELFREVQTITPLSTIGAGDTFNAGLLYGIWKQGYGRSEIAGLRQDQWEVLLDTAIAFSREVCLSYENYLPLEKIEALK